MLSSATNVDEEEKHWRKEAEVYLRMFLVSEVSINFAECTKLSHSGKLRRDWKTFKRIKI